VSDKLSGWEALGIALAGGAIAWVLGMVVTYWASFWGAYFDVREHDRVARERDQDLESWVADRSIVLRRELEAVTNEHSHHKDGTGTSFHSGAHAKDRAKAKEKALHEYRDQERQALRDVARLRESEGRMHFHWRRTLGLRPPELRAPKRVQAALDFWRLPVTKHEGGAALEVRDPTKETLDSTVAELDQKDFN
jgi:hypothetical protein